ncbi:hypothetical protein [Lysinibacter cavernae]|uniref:Uncharacterized protein n=1 Tax=Lysinibacter cavernae TaxID=1640652 RepID=A0A7X5R0C8_9MICO|nr:hypothetical protein [Lysinibacter cavernae]NIH53313.1 hypothetical protein [Lysinibacter cavernae]
MSTTTSVLKLQFAKRDLAFLTPLATILLTLVLTAIIAFILQRAGLDPNSEGYEFGARQNAGMMYALPGFLIYMGVQSVGTTFPFAMSLGTARRNFVQGTALTFVGLSLYVTGIMTVLLALEKLTDHWFANIYAIDVYVLGAGDFGLLIPITFFATLACLSIGGAFGAVYVRFRNKGPIVMGLSIGIVLAAAALLLVPYFGDIVESFNRWWGVLIAVAICGGSLIAMRLALGRASVR